MYDKAKKTAQRALTFFGKQARRYAYKRKGVRVLAATKRQPHTQKAPSHTREHQVLWKPIAGHVSPEWYEAYCRGSGIDDARYVPEDVYYAFVEPALNAHRLAAAYSDKNMYERFYDASLFPETLFRNMSGVLYDRGYTRLTSTSRLDDLLAERDAVIAKPSIDSGGGRKVEVFDRQEGQLLNDREQPLTLEYLRSRYGQDYIVQDYIEQANYFRAFNPSSLNTVRVYTYRSISTEEIIVDHAVLRMGGKGSRIDNESAGGISAFVHEGGRLNSYAIDKYGKRYRKSPGGAVFEEAAPVPRFDEMKEKARQIARQTYYDRLLGFDFCVDREGNVKLIEINNENIAVSFLQFVNGPLFGDRTAEVISYCRDQEPTPVSVTL